MNASEDYFDFRVEFLNPAGDLKAAEKAETYDGNLPDQACIL